VQGDRHHRLELAKPISVVQLIIQIYEDEDAIILWFPIGWDMKT